MLGALAILVRAADSPRAQVIQIDHQKVAAAFAKGEGLLATNNFKIQAGRREVAGEVEVHDSDTDIFYILEGSATFVTGGNPVQPRTVAPGETRAREIAGASRMVRDWLSNCMDLVCRGRGARAMGPRNASANLAHDGERQ